jgi:Histidine kinase-, DNA gyrase B-, and HSP90-like ATPase
VVGAPGFEPGASCAQASRAISWKSFLFNLYFENKRLSKRNSSGKMYENVAAHAWSPLNFPLSEDKANCGKDKKACLDVIDRGPGIPAEHQPYVFDRFYRVDKARTREWGGAGLGLSITRWAIEAHGGEISLSSKGGDGCTFRVCLPMASDISNPTTGRVSATPRMGNDL